MKYVVNTYYDPIPPKAKELTAQERTALKDALRAEMAKPRTFDDLAHVARRRHAQVSLAVVTELLSEMMDAKEIKSGERFPDPSTIQVEPETVEPK